MRVLYSPQFNDNERIKYTFEHDKVIAEKEKDIEVFDFNGMPDGKAENIESDVFEFCPVLSAERKEGVLHLELLNFIGFDATEEEKFPEWIDINLLEDVL